MTCHSWLRGWTVRRGAIAVSMVVMLGCGSAPPAVDEVAQEAAAACAAAPPGGPVAALPMIRATLSALTARFKNSVPTSEDVLRFLDAGFRHNGLSATTYLRDVLLNARGAPGGFDYVGFEIDDVEIAEAVDDSHVLVTFTASVAHPTRPWLETMLMTRKCGRWLLSGNGDIALAKVSFRARLGEVARTRAELDDNPDVFTIWADWLTVPQYAYVMNIPSSSDPQAVGWIGFPGDPTYGLIAWVGDSVDYSDTPENERELRRAYTQYLGSASSRVRAYLVFDVSSVQVDPDVATVHVAGPGLPAAGLDLDRPADQFPRPYFVLRGDQGSWNAFSTERCAAIGPVPGCALDWSQVHSGSSYTFTFYDADGVVLGELSRTLRAEHPLGETELYEARDEYFGQLTLAPPYQFTISNILDTSTDAPFVGGGSVELTWKLPTNPDVQLDGVSYWREYFLDDDIWNPEGKRQEDNWYALYGTGATSVTAKSAAIPNLTNWAWSTLIFSDEYGNVFDHEVSPLNPY